MGSLADDCPGRRGRLSALSVFLCKSILYGAFVWARRALKHQKHRFPARAVEQLGALLPALEVSPTGPTQNSQVDPAV
jgi:hypothetical protein